MEKLTHTTYRTDRATLLKFYQTLIRPVLDYGAPLYGFATQSRIDSLNTILNTSFRLITSAFCTTPIDSLLCESSELSLAICRHLAATSAYLNILSNPNFHSCLSFTLPPTSIHYYNLVPLQWITSKNTEILNYPFNTNPPQSTFTPIIDLTLTDLGKTQIETTTYVRNFENLIKKYPNFTLIFTACSKSLDNAGCTFIHDTYSIPFPRPPHFSVLSVELFVLKLAVDYWSNLDSSNILILTDSLSALLSIQNDHKKKQHTISQEIAHILSTINKEIVLAWIPSHLNIDQTAKLSLIIFPIPKISVPLSDLKKKIKTSISKEFRHF